jgi:hypothetical protein
VTMYEGAQGWRAACATLAAEVRRLRTLATSLREAVKQANDQAERFEREWYLRGDAIERAADVARNACDGWREPLMHEGARIAGDAVQNLMGPNASFSGGPSGPSAASDS